MSPAGDDALSSGDGTHASSTADSFGDPLSGLVTGSDTDLRDDFGPMRIAEPVKPDVDAVKQMVDAAMGGEVPVEPAEAESPSAPLAGPAAPAGGTQQQFGLAEPLGMLPQQRNWPARQVMRPGRRAKVRLPRPKVGLPKTKPTRGSAGVIVAVVLLIVFGVVLIELISSLVGTVSGLFD
ncbi:hypothetical protein [Amycolatopsis nigrescens]|uniref:hypothetical protein n=1 Tax=Amycolatopsis nigrescens TaxID=381445 RepID=UPI0003828BAC|nr:hypothetical protein [Amycolatopsis nigrescens]